SQEGDSQEGDSQEGDSQEGDSQEGDCPQRGDEERCSRSMAALRREREEGPVAHGSDAEARIRRVVGRIFDLPSFPIVIRKLMVVAEDPHSSARDLAAVMAQDQAISAKILKLVNSAFYSLQRPVSSLQHAVSLLGYNSVRSMALSVSIFNAFGGEAGSGPFTYARFWQHAVAAALGARTLAQIGQKVHPDEAFTAGLIHDIGLLLEARYLTAEFEAAVSMAIRNAVSLRAAEIEVLGVDHPLIGGWLSEAWRLPEPVRDAIVYHHDWALERTATDEAREMTRIVSIVNRLIRAEGWTYEPSPILPEEDPVEEGELAEIEASALIEEIRKSLESCRALLAS
ncbi:MAG: HDOD domain-containing protein, partial [Planctomycetes bacterium]|nr:HDOD domain-containing protein [Planctomycetota bacterium]